MPWKVSATFTLDGPNVSASEISGASGMVGVRITLHAVDADKTADLTPIVAFTIPSRVGNDVTADDGVAVSSDNTSTPVSYTHLDVYKRQGQGRRQHRMDRP